jgi:hypothetical protein
MRASIFLCLLSLLSVSFSAQAEDQVLHYDLVLDGVSVGQRQVEVRYLPPPAGEMDQARMIRSTMDIEVSMGRKAYTLESRVSAFHGPSGANFSSSVLESGVAREVQGRSERDGSWSVVSLENGLRSAWSFNRKEVGLTTMDLHDPERYERMLDHASNPMLITENGQVSLGQVREHGEVRIEVAGKMITVQRVSWTSDAGELLLHFSEDGLLVDYSLDFLGKRLHAALRELPGERSWGGFDPTVAGEVSEEEL